MKNPRFLLAGSHIPLPRRTPRQRFFFWLACWTSPKFWLTLRAIRQYERDAR